MTQETNSTEPKTQAAHQLDLNPLTVEDAADRMFQTAAEMRASDLFILSHENYMSVQVRHLGKMLNLGIISPEKGKRLIQYIKGQSEMDVSERRRPSDGRWLYNSESLSEAVDMRINTIPTLFGEDMTIRLLLHRQSQYQLDQLGMTTKQLGEFRAMIESPGGLVLCVGPTNAGKSTTLYAALHHLHDGTRKINTIEDPIEYAIDGVRQSQVDPILKVGFDDLLRGVMRQSPDVLMIGEIRDTETANIAIRAANSGRLVLASIHASVATSAVEAMLSFGVNPHFLATGLRGVIAQRLVRTLNPEKRLTVDLDGHHGLIDPIRHLIDHEPKLFAADPTAPHQGYVGRTGIFEVFQTEGEIRRLIATEVDAMNLRSKAIQLGMMEFRLSALLKVAQGITSIEEIFNAIPSEFLTLDEENHNLAA